MALNTISHHSHHSSGSGVFPALVFVQGSEQKNIVLNRTPFTVGRKVDKDLVIADPRVSRDHAQIMQEGQEFFIEDLGSKHGTFVNGERIQRQKLERGDRLEFGARDSAYILFNPAHATSNTAREFLSQISVIGGIKPETTELETLRLFLEAARKLNTAGVLDEILITMLDVTLELTKAERAYVFLKDEDGKLSLKAGRNSKKEPLLDDKTISHSILEESMRSNSEFLLTDTSQSLDLSGRQSIVAYDLRTVVCIPLRKLQLQQTRDAQTPAPGIAAQAMGVLYVDSRFASRDISDISRDILHAIATEAASLIENARLVQAEEEARRYQQELSIAASIQQRLMQVKIPEVPFARLRGRNLSCKEIGGDFFDAVNTKEGLAVVLADVSGKGVSAALLASTLQGMIYSHLSAGMPLLNVVSAVNRFFTDKLGGRKICHRAVSAPAPRWGTRIRELRPRAAAAGMRWRGYPSDAWECSGWVACRCHVRKRDLSDEVRRPLHPRDRRRHRSGERNGRLLRRFPAGSSGFQVPDSGRDFFSGHGVLRGESAER